MDNLKPLPTPFSTLGQAHSLLSKGKKDEKAGREEDALLKYRDALDVCNKVKVKSNSLTEELVKVLTFAPLLWVMVKRLTYPVPTGGDRGIGESRKP